MLQDQASGNGRCQKNEMSDPNTEVDLDDPGSSERGSLKHSRPNRVPSACKQQVRCCADYKSSVFQPALISSNQILKIVPYSLPDTSNLANPVKLSPNGTVTLSPLIGDFVTYRDTSGRLGFGIVEQIGHGSDRGMATIRTVRNGRPVEQQTHCRTLRLVYRTSETASPVNNWTLCFCIWVRKISKLWSVKSCRTKSRKSLQDYNFFNSFIWKMENKVTCSNLQVSSQCILYPDCKINGLFFVLCQWD